MLFVKLCVSQSQEWAFAIIFPGRLSLPQTLPTAKLGGLRSTPGPGLRLCQTSRKPGPMGLAGRSPPRISWRGLGGAESPHVRVTDEQIIQVPGCGDYTGLGHGRTFVSVVVVMRLGADVPNILIIVWWALLINKSMVEC